MTLLPAKVFTLWGKIHFKLFTVITVIQDEAKAKNPLSTRSCLYSYTGSNVLCIFVGAHTYPSHDMGMFDVPMWLCPQEFGVAAKIEETSESR